MPKTIPQLTDATTVNAADELIIQQAGVTKRATGAELAKGLNTINGTVNVKDFGAIGDGVADDTAAIQAAVNSKANIYFPEGEYLVTQSIICNNRGQKLYSIAALCASAENTEASPEDRSALIKYNKQDGSYAFVVNESQVHFIGLGFFGVSSTNNNGGILFQKLTNTDDMDGYVMDCNFLKLQSPILHYGRSLTALNNLFVACGMCITLDWPSTGTNYTSPNQEPPRGYRATRIIGNRFHFTAGGVEARNTSGNSQAILRGAIIANNMMDLGFGPLYKGSAGTLNTHITGNIAEFNSSIQIEFNNVAKNCIVTNNVFSGNPTKDTETPYASIVFQTCSEIADIVVSGNTYETIDGYCVSIQDDTGAVTANVDNVVFTNNTCSDIGLDGNSTRAIFRTLYSIDGFVFTSNIAAKGAPPTIIRFENASLTLNNARIFNNIVDTSKTFINSVIYGTNVSIEDGKGNFGFNTPSTSIKVAVQDTQSVLMQGTRTGSSGGVGARLTNNAGFIDVFATPTGSNAGAVETGADDVVSLGTASRRWSQLFAATNVINTSDEREKQQIRNLSEAEKRVAIKLKSLVKAFKFNNAVFTKGDNARIHVGVVAQEVVAAFESEGLDATRYGLLCYDEWEEKPEEKDPEGNVMQARIPAGNRYGIRYEQLLSFIVAAQ